MFLDSRAGFDFVDRFASWHSLLRDGDRGAWMGSQSVVPRTSGQTEAKDHLSTLVVSSGNLKIWRGEPNTILRPAGSLGWIRWITRWTASSNPLQCLFKVIFSFGGGVAYSSGNSHAVKASIWKYYERLLWPILPASNWQKGHFSAWSSKNGNWLQAKFKLALHFHAQVAVIWLFIRNELCTWKKSLLSSWIELMLDKGEGHPWKFLVHLNYSTYHKSIRCYLWVGTFADLCKELLILSICTCGSYL